MRLAPTLNTDLAMTHRLRHASLILATVLLCTSPLTRAERNHRDDDSYHHDHDHARHALMRGEILPLDAILSRLGARLPGEVIGLEFEQEREQGRVRWVYELRILDSDGHLLEVEVDAHDGRILDWETD